MTEQLSTAILVWVAAATSVPIGTLVGRNRSPEVVRARTLAIHSMSVLGGLGPSAIVPQVRRDRTTVAVALAWAERLIASDWTFGRWVSRLRAVGAPAPDHSGASA